jgi:transcriptional regulator with XRE-family HTH domain
MRKPDAAVEIVRCKIVGNRLDEAMAKQGLSRREAARRAQITDRQLLRFVKNEHCPSLERAWALSAVLAEPVEKLFTVEIKTRRAVSASGAFDRIPTAD